jgi:hypothetical protein
MKYGRESPVSILIESGRNNEPINKPKRVMKYMNGKSGTFLYSLRNEYINEDSIKVKNPKTIESFHKILLISFEIKKVIELMYSDEYIIIATNNVKKFRNAINFVP